MWIRSQGKETLILLNGVEYRQQRERHCIFGISTYGDDIHIASYNTKERCIEVLDEIQEHIETRVVADELMKSMIDTMTDESDKETYTERLRKLSCVYVMPEV